MRFPSSIRRVGELFLVEALVTGPADQRIADLVLDTGASSTMLTHELAESIGYSRRDAYQHSNVRTVVGEEVVYWVRVVELDMLGIVTPDFAVTVGSLRDHKIDGLVGMSFLRHLNFEVRPAENRILVELIQR